MKVMMLEQIEYLTLLARRVVMTVIKIGPIELCEYQQRMLDTIESLVTVNLFCDDFGDFCSFHGWTSAVPKTRNARFPMKYTATAM